jgi:hypothetical protein
MPLTRLSKAILSQVGEFVQTLGEACPKPSRKFLYEMTLGLTMSGSILLSEVARKLKALKPITFHALHKGLCRNLKSKRWSALPVEQGYLKKVAKHLAANTFVAVDLGDITKPRARKMPGLRTVRDGSTKTLKKGWWLVEIEAIFGKGNHLPLWLELFSVSRKGYKSQRFLIQQAIATLVQHLGLLGTWLFDRGFDNWEFFAFLRGLKLKFLIRVNSNRTVNIPDGRSTSMGKLAGSLPAQARFVWGRKRQGCGYVIEVAWAEFSIPQNDQKLWLLVARGFGRHPMLLVTNRPVDQELCAVKLVRAYLKRWGVEEAGRLVKQVFDLENLRVLSWAGLVKLVWLAMWAYGLLCLVRLKSRTVYEALLKIYPSFGPTPRYPYYRIAGGLAFLLLVGSLTDPGLLSGLWETG